MASVAGQAARRDRAASGPSSDAHDGREVGVHPPHGREGAAADSRDRVSDDGARSLELALNVLAARGLLERARVVHVGCVRVELDPVPPPKALATEPHLDIERRAQEEEELMYGSSS